MEFGLSEDQVMLQDSVKGAMSAAAPLDTVRLVAAGGAEERASVLGAFDGLGTAGLLVPESLGGLGMGLLDAALVSEALGGGVTPVPYIAHQIGVAGVMAGGSDTQKADWLGRAASGEVRFGAAVTEMVSRREGAGVSSASGKLSGKAMFVMGARTATHLIVADSEGDLHIAEVPDAVSDLITIDKTRDITEIEFINTPAERLNNRGAQAAIRTGRLLLAADSLGASQFMLEKAVEYAKERKQFGRVIGSFQAVKHMCADMAAKLEPSRALIWHAAHAVDTGDAEADIMICLAKAHLDDVSTYVSRTATEVYGGMGFTDLVGLHYWFKRTGLNRQLLGGPEQVRLDAAKLQGWAA